MTQKRKQSLHSSVGIEEYGTSHPGIGGVIKSSPEDFQVSEILPNGNQLSVPQNLGPEEEGLFVHLILRKRGIDTLRAIEILSKALKKDKNTDFGFAGLKDATAVTTQRISIWRGSSQALQKLSLDNIEILGIKHKKFPVRIGELWGNHFEITVREISFPDPDTQERINRIKGEIKQLGGFPNYFGLQRFGSTRPVSHIVGREILRGNFEEAVMCYLTTASEIEPDVVQKARRELVETRNFNMFLDKMPRKYRFERILANSILRRNLDFQGALFSLPQRMPRFFVGAYQSFLFNKVLSFCLRDNLLLDKKQFNIPILGYGSRLKKTEIHEKLQEELAKDELSIGSFRLEQKTARLRGSERLAIEKSVNLEIPVDSGIVTFCFSLSRGAYGTILLREFIK